jgi:molybdopterin converting factor small subunit
MRIWTAFTTGEPELENSMDVKVILHTTLQRQSQNGLMDPIGLTMPEGACVGDVLRKLEIQLEPGALILVINHKVVSQDTLLKDGNRLDIIPAISGGSQN